MTQEVNGPRIPFTDGNQREIFDQNNSRPPLPAAVRERFSKEPVKPSAPGSFTAAASPPAAARGVDAASREAIAANPQNRRTETLPQAPLPRPEPRFARQASSSSEAPKNPTDALIERLDLKRLPLDKVFDLDTSDGANGKKCSAEIRSSSGAKLIHDDREIPGYAGAGAAGVIAGGAAYFGLAIVAWPAALIAGLCAAIGIYFRLSSDHPTVRWAKEILSRNLCDLLRNPPQKNEEMLTDKTYCIWFREEGGRVVWSGLAEQRTIKEAPGFINREEERTLEFAVELNLSRHTYRIYFPQGSRIQASHLSSLPDQQIIEIPLEVIVDPIGRSSNTPAASSSIAGSAPQKEFSRLFDGFANPEELAPGESVSVPSVSGNAYHFSASLDGKSIHLNFTIGNKIYQAAVRSEKDTPEGIVDRRFLQQFRFHLSQGRERREAFNLAKKSIVNVLLHNMREHPSAEAELERISGLDVKTFFTEQKLCRPPASASSQHIPSVPKEEGPGAGSTNQHKESELLTAMAPEGPESLGSSMELPQGEISIAVPSHATAEVMEETLEDKAMRAFRDLLRVRFGSLFEEDLCSNLHRIFKTEIGAAYEPNSDILKDVARAGDTLNRRAATCCQVVSTTPDKDPLYARSKLQLDGIIHDIETLERCKKVLHSQSVSKGMPNRLIMPEGSPAMSSSSSNSPLKPSATSLVVPEADILDILEAELGSKFHRADAKLVQQAEIKIMGKFRGASSAEEKLRIQAVRQKLSQFSSQMKKENPGWGKASPDRPLQQSSDAPKPSSSAHSKTSIKAERVETLDQKTERLLLSDSLDGPGKEKLRSLKAELTKLRGDLGKIEVLLESHAKAIKKQAELLGKRNPTAEDKAQLEALNGYLQRNSLAALTNSKMKIIGAISGAEHAISGVFQQYQ